MKKNKKTIQKDKTITKTSEQLHQPVLRFSPTAWAKLLYFRDKTDNEVGGFGITKKDDLFYVTDFVTVKQKVTAISVKFDDESVSAFFEDQVDLGRKPEQFARLWLHTHPGSFAEPSAIDEQTFVKVFGNCNWAVMVILAEDNEVYARLSFNIGPKGQMQIPVEIDYGHQFGPSDMENWDNEYKTNITVDSWLGGIDEDDKETNDLTSLNNCAWPQDVIEQFEQMSPEERQVILDELAVRPELWDEEEVMYL